MLRYSVFWIEEEFSYHYFYRAEILYRFLNGWQEPVKSADYNSQFNYVTRILPVSELISHFSSAGSAISVEKTSNVLSFHSGRQRLTLSVEERIIHAECEFFQEAEALLFQSLRKFDDNFFAVETSQENYGWISTGKKRNHALNHQLLYSFR